MNQIGLEDFVQPTLAAQTNSSNIFSCCSRYRECSDARQCLIADQEHSGGCKYRVNLEAGNIFYGKNAVGFSLDEYHSYCNLIESLATPAQTEYRRILVYRFSLAPGTLSVLWDNSNHLKALADAELCVVSSCKDYILGECLTAKLRKELSADSTYGALWKSAKAPVGMSKTQTEFLTKWITENADSFLAALSEPY